MLKRMIALLLTMVLVLGLVPVSMAAESTQTDLEKSIEKQIRAFADSIDQPKADDTAAWAIATHGMTAGGKKLSVGKNHSLTATLWNSELVQYMMVDILTNAVITMQQTDTEVIEQATGIANWGNDLSYYMFTKAVPEGGLEDYDWALVNGWGEYADSANAYDNSLIWIAGATVTCMNMERVRLTQSAVTYHVTMLIKDRFDFNTAGNDFSDS